MHLKNALLACLLFCAIAILLFATLRETPEFTLDKTQNTSSSVQHSSNESVSLGVSDHIGLSLKDSETTAHHLRHADHDEYVFASIGALGFALPNGQRVDSYFNDLLNASERGSAQASLLAAKIASTCGTLTRDKSLLDTPSHPFHMIATDCSFISVGSFHQKAHELVNSAARLGSRDAAIKQISYPPPEGTREELLEWEREVESRLNSYSKSYDIEASLVLAQAYDYGFSKLRSHEEAIRYYTEYLKYAADGDRRVSGVEHRLSLLLQGGAAADNPAD